ncbi:MAG: hypothetical protein PHI59_05870 [Candidatus Omnitrophica bacterium]|nr:hypothetical protein [Candidatus Omnitrophota bacterium]
MKKLALFFILMFLTLDARAAGKSICEQFEGYPEIKVFLGNTFNKSSNPVVDTEVFAFGFRDALEGRKAIKFVPVVLAARADIIIEATIKDFVFVKEAAPLPLGALSLAADVADPKCSIRLIVAYKIIDTKSGELLGKYDNFETNTRESRKDMTEKAAFKYAAKDNANKFLLAVFYKPRN